MRKPVFGVFDQVRHKPGCTIIEDGKRFEISDLGSKGLYYPCSENKGADQLRGYREADLRLCFRICKNPVFSDAAHIIDKYFCLVCLIQMNCLYVHLN